MGSLVASRAGMPLIVVMNVTSSLALGIGGALSAGADHRGGERLSLDLPADQPADRDPWARSSSSAGSSISYTGKRAIADTAFLESSSSSATGASGASFPIPPSWPSRSSAGWR